MHEFCVSHSRKPSLSVCQSPDSEDMKVVKSDTMSRYWYTIGSFLIFSRYVSSNYYWYCHKWERSNYGLYIGFDGITCAYYKNTSFFREVHGSSSFWLRLGNHEILSRLVLLSLPRYHICNTTGQDLWITFRSIYQGRTTLCLNLKGLLRTRSTKHYQAFACLTDKFHCHSKARLRILRHHWYVESCSKI